ncbi:MAG: alanine/glycine:cation symporter family protein [Pirellulaceae bacterium]
MSTLEYLTSSMANWVWSLPLFLLLLSCGMIFSIVSKFVQWRILTHGYACIRGAYDRPGDTGHISHFQALCAALSATIGLGNIAGVAVAVSLGGPGAVFWMWVVGLFGMALKFAECTLAVMYRDVRDVPDPSAPALASSDMETRTLQYAGEQPPDPHATPAARGEVRGGPMWYIQKGLVDPLYSRGNILWVAFKVLAILFAIATVLNSFGGGNMFQGWNVSDMLGKHLLGSFSDGWNVPRGLNPQRLVPAVLFSLMVAMVIIGGIKRIGQVAARLVPFMCIIYVLASLYVILAHATDLPGYLATIVQSAFTAEAEGGAFAGVTIWMAFQQGLRRACFSNEAGEGSAAIAHAAARTEEPVREGVVAGLGPFIDTLIICTLSALVILISGVWNRAPVGHVARLENGKVVVHCDGELSDTHASLYLQNVTRADRLRVHLARGIGVDFEDLAIPVASVQIAEGGTWDDVESITLDTSHLQRNDRALVERIAVGQPVHLDITGADMTGFAFETSMPGIGRYMVILAACLFAFSTMISWSYYGEKGTEYLLGPRAILPYKLVFVIFVFLGMVLPEFRTVYDFSDATTGLMVLCNLPALLILSPVVVRATRSYFRRLDAGEFRPVEK